MHTRCGSFRPPHALTSVKGVSLMTIRVKEGLCSERGTCQKVCHCSSGSPWSLCFRLFANVVCGVFPESSFEKGNSEPLSRQLGSFCVHTADTVLSRSRGTWGKAGDGPLMHSRSGPFLHGERHGSRGKQGKVLGPITGICPGGRVHSNVMCRAIPCFPASGGPGALARTDTTPAN